jgi:hypothetical protein
MPALCLGARGERPSCDPRSAAMRSRLAVFRVDSGKTHVQREHGQAQDS